MSTGCTETRQSCLAEKRAGWHTRHPLSGLYVAQAITLHKLPGYGLDTTSCPQQHQSVKVVDNRTREGGMQREFHQHYGRQYHARANYVRAKAETLPGSGLKPGTRPRWIRTGTLCYYCGFTPNQEFLRVHEDLRRRAIRGE